MAVNELITAREFCNHYDLDLSFIESLHDSGLIEMVVIEHTPFVREEQLPVLEQLVHFHEMGINVEGMEAVTHLLTQLQELQQRLLALRNRLHAIE